MTTTDEHILQPKGPALSAVLGTSSTWERTLVPIEPAARAALFAVSALELLVAVGQYFLARALPAKAPGLYFAGWPQVTGLISDVARIAPLYVALAVAHLAACVLTQGFAIAGRRLQIGLGFLAVVSGVALLPVLGASLITVANIAAWATLVVLVIVLIAGLIAAAFS